MRAAEVLAEEALSTLHQTVIARIRVMIVELNSSYLSSTKNNFSIFRRAMVDEDGEGIPFILILMDEEATDTERKTYTELLKDRLAQAGYMGGVMPVQVTLSTSAFERNALVLRFNRK